jgi:hypothetical protein
MKSRFSAQDESNRSNIISSGADLGAKTGLLLSALYSVLVVAIFGSWELAGSYFVIVLGLYAAILIPVLLLGILTGAILGWLSKRLSGVVSKPRFIQVGILVCIILVVALHLVYFTGIPLLTAKYAAEPFVPSLSIREYWIFIGFPSIIYMISGGWLSHELWMKA